MSPLCGQAWEDAEKVRVDLFGFMNEMGKNVPEGGHNMGLGMEVGKCDAVESPFMPVSRRPEAGNSQIMQCL